ncbi:MAG: YicC family protein [Peptostreptococcaceae bacterium]|nr:YicC family protein [Peptostreptococcaceae bacterium]
MIKSMTGFGRSEYSDQKRNIIVEIRSVNHRYCDIGIRLPRRFGFAEDKIRGTVKEKLKRGKIEISIIIDDFADGDTDVRLNKALAKKYYEAFSELKEELNIKDHISLTDLANQSDVIKAIPKTEDEDEILKSILIPLRQAVDNIYNMRGIEGEKLAEDILMRTDVIANLVSSIEERAPKISADYVEKLKFRISALVNGEIEIPEDRILIEAAMFADKSNIDEEIVRLKSHIDQLKNILADDTNSIGKRIDFLVQEMNREVNTIGSKANDIEITNYMLDAKSEIEKIREQVQNIE